jgi:hypothetical protein
MKRKFFKKMAVAAVGVVLIYYNVAWAVLRCPHQENQSQEIAVYDPDSWHRHVNIDCTGPEYHTEFLAGPSTNAELLQLTRDVAFDSFFGLSGHARAGSASLLVLSEELSSAALPVGPPRYISLSVFRL